MGYNIIAKTGLFTAACREWCLLDPETQSFAAFQVHFRKMDNYRHIHTLTSASAGYHLDGRPDPGKPCQPFNSWYHHLITLFRPHCPSSRNHLPESTACISGIHSTCNYRPPPDPRHQGVLLDAWQQQQCSLHQCLLQYPSSHLAIKQVPRIAIGWVAACANMAPLLFLPLQFHEPEGWLLIFQTIPLSYANKKHHVSMMHHRIMII